MYVVHAPAPVHPSWFPQCISVEEGGLQEGKTGQVCTGWLCADVHVSLYYCTVNSSQDLVYFHGQLHFFFLMSGREKYIWTLWAMFDRSHAWNVI